MTKIRKGDQIIEIDCDGEWCGNCRFVPKIPLDQECKLFNLILDHLSGSGSKAGWIRLTECKEAEVKE